MWVEWLSERETYWNHQHLSIGDYADYCISK